MTIIDCGTTSTYTDDGGSGNYSANINGIYRTFCPGSDGKSVTATFISMGIEENVASCYDYLIVRDGPTQGSNIIWAGCYDGDGTYNTLIGVWASVMTSTDASGCLTFQFTSDNTNQLSGWNVQLTCTNSSVTHANNDCASAQGICGSTNFNGASSGPGLISTCGGCNLSENYSNWYFFEVTTSGRMQFSVHPTDNFDDYDFALYKATGCGEIQANGPMRCSYAMSPWYCDVTSDNTRYISK
jgi:hypothetical protein